MPFCIVFPTGYGVGNWFWHRLIGSRFCPQPESAFLTSVRIEWSNERMKLPVLFSAVLAMLGLASTGLATDYADWVAKGYRWSAVHGRVAYATKEEARSVGRKSESDSSGHGYYLRPGKLVLVVETDTAFSLSRIRMNGVTSPLWTATKNLSTRPVKNVRGVIESPDSTGLRPISRATPSPLPLH
jgi:hypothetical protein